MSVHVYFEVSPIIAYGVYSQLSVNRIAALVFYPMEKGMGESAKNILFPCPCFAARVQECAMDVLSEDLAFIYLQYSVETRALPFSFVFKGLITFMNFTPLYLLIYI